MGARRAGALLGVGDEAMEEAGRALREAQAEQLLEERPPPQ